MDRALRYNEEGPAKRLRQPSAAQRAGHYVRSAYVRKRSLVACGVAALLGGVVYLNALRNPFVYDDYHTVVENRSIGNVTDVRAIVLGALTRPIVNFSYAIDRAIWGTEPLGFHVTNVLLHMLNVILLFQLARRFGKDELAAFAAAGLFAVHPMMTEAVGYISGRSEVLCATFFLFALMCGRRLLRGDGAQWGVFTVGLWCAALATKESAAMFPFVFLLYDWLGAGGTVADKRHRLHTVHLPIIGAAVLVGIVRFLIFARLEYTGQSSIHWNYVLLELDVIRRYVWMMINPVGQTIFHEVAAASLFDPHAWLAMFSLGLMVALSWKLRRVDWVASIGMLWFLLLLAPSSALIALGQGEPMAEHRVYLASCGIFLTAGAVVSWLGAWMSHLNVRHVRVAGAVVLGLVLLSFGAETILRNAVWADPVTLWRESVTQAPAHYRPRLLLGEALQDAGRRDEAVVQFRTAIRLRPTEPIGYVKVGQSLAQLGEWAEARRHFLKAIEIDPGNVSARKSLTVLGEMESKSGHDAGRR